MSSFQLQEPQNKGKCFRNSAQQLKKTLKMDEKACKKFASPYSARKKPSFSSPRNGFNAKNSLSSLLQPGQDGEEQRFPWWTRQGGEKMPCLSWLCLLSGWAQTMKDTTHD